MFELLNCKTDDGKLISPAEFENKMQEKYNCKGISKTEFFNANGDINPSALAYRYTTDRMTYIRARTIQQTFYQVNVPEYITLIPGEGAFASQLITQANVIFSGTFRSGKISSAGQGSKLQNANAGVVPFYTAVANWGFGTDYTIFDVAQATFMGQWDPIEAKQKSRKMIWDLGIQEVAFLGDSDNLTQFPGLLTQPQVNVNQAVITANISSLAYTDFNTLVQLLLASFLTNCNNVTWPDTFMMPQDDYAGMGVAVNPQYPNITKMSYLQQAFDMIVPGKKVKILPSIYCMTANNGGAFGIGKQCYLLYKNNIDTCFMELPVDFVTTAYGTANNFNFQDCAYGQYTGVQFLKPMEAVLYTHS